MKPKGAMPMTRVVEVTHTELLSRRAAILERHNLTLADFAERAAQYELVGEQWDDWAELEKIAFLLGEDDKD